MPAINHGATLARQWELLKLIPKRAPGMTSSALRAALERAGYAVTKRTVERDLTELSRHFAIQRNEISTPFGWHVAANADLDLSGMELGEAVSLGMLEEVLKSLMPSTVVAALERKFSRAGEKLAAMSKHPSARWSDLVRYLPPGLPFHPPALAPDILPQVQEALVQQQLLEAEYSPSGAAAVKSVTLIPLALIQQGVRPYLLACTADDPAPKYYALQRIVRATRLERRAVRPKGFSLDAFIASGSSQFGAGTPIRLKAVISAELAGILTETPIAGDQRIIPRGEDLMLTATVIDSWQLGFWLRSQGRNIAVLQPIALRRKVVESLKAALSRYEAL